MPSLRHIVVELPDGVKINVREPRIKDYLAANKITDEQEKTVVLLAGMVLNDDGNPVGREGVEELPLSVLSILAEKVSELIGGATSGPLDQKSISSTG
jgi:hypothetical protein